MELSSITIVGSRRKKPCPNIGQLILHISFVSQPFENHVISISKNQASRGVKPSLIMIASLGGFTPEETVSRLREHAEHFAHRASHAPPPWDDIPSESSSESK